MDQTKKRLNDIDAEMQSLEMKLARLERQHMEEEGGIRIVLNHLNIERERLLQILSQPA